MANAYGCCIGGIDDQPVRSRSDLTLILERRTAGEEVTVVYLRGGEEQRVRMVLESDR